VRDWMTEDPRVARPGTASAEADLMMLEQGCHHLPVVDEADRPVGVVGMRAVVSTRARETEAGPECEGTLLAGLESARWLERRQLPRLLPPGVACRLAGQRESPLCGGFLVWAGQDSNLRPWD
jgi:hypothetical protein